MKIQNECGSASTNSSHKNINPEINPLPKELKNYNYGKIDADSASTNSPK